MQYPDKEVGEVFGKFVCVIECEIGLERPIRVLFDPIKSVFRLLRVIRERIEKMYEIKTGDVRSRNAAISVLQVLSFTNNIRPKWLY